MQWTSIRSGRRQGDQRGTCTMRTPWALFPSLNAVFSLASECNVSNGFGLNILCINFPSNRKLMVWVKCTIWSWPQWILQECGLFGCRNWEHLNYTVGLKCINHYIPKFNVNIVIQSISSVLPHSIAPVVGPVLHMNIAPFGNWSHWVSSSSAFLIS